MVPEDAPRTETESSQRPAGSAPPRRGRGRGRGRRGRGRGRRPGSPNSPPDLERPGPDISPPEAQEPPPASEPEVVAEEQLVSGTLAPEPVPDSFTEPLAPAEVEASTVEEPVAASPTPTPTEPEAVAELREAPESGEPESVASVAEIPASEQVVSSGPAHPSAPPPPHRTPAREFRPAQPATLQKTVEEVNHIVEVLRDALEEMEEVLETLEIAERQKDADEREIESLRRALRQLQRPRDGGHPPRH